MAPKKTKIVLDADVIIHFIEGECFSVLFSIFTEYEYIILDKVYEELGKRKETRRMIDNYESRLRKFKVVKFSPAGDSVREYAQLTRTKGKGESACMIYCRDNNDVIGSSNLRDIEQFCIDNGITYLTTLDFIYYAYRRKVMTLEECNKMIGILHDKGENIPAVRDISRYTCTTTV